MGSTQYNMTNYEQTYREYNADLPEFYNFASQVIDKWAKTPDKPAMLWVDDQGNEVRRTFQDIRRRSMQAANALAALGLKRDDRILVVLGRQLAWWEVVTACIRMGAVAIPTITMLTAKDIQFRADESGACCIITDNVTAAKFDGIADKCPNIKHRIVVGETRMGWTTYEEMVEAADDQFQNVRTKSYDPCLCYFTSSTQGFPKMVVHTHASMALPQKVTAKYWLDLKPDDLHWNLSDTGWAKAAWSSYFGPWYIGATVFIHHTEGFNAKKILGMLAKYPITTLCATPTIYRMLVLQNLKAYKFPHLRHCVGAGEPMTPEIIEIWKNDTGCTIHDGYGQTETGLLAANFPCFEVRLGSMGKPVPGVELAVIDDNGDIQPPDVEGTIAIKVIPHRPLGFFTGYAKEQDNEPHRYLGQWYLTGDRAYVDSGGYFWFVGRADDVILSAGYRVGPVEVEYTLMAHPAVFEAAVVSSPDETRGQLVKAFVVLAEGYTAGEEMVKTLQDHVKAMILPYKYPRIIQFVSELPKTFSGKIRRVDLRELEWKEK